MVLTESKETSVVLETPELHRKFLNVTYAYCTDDEVMDIYLPEEGDGPLKSSLKLKPVLTGLKRGYAVVSLQYTWSVHGRFPIQIYDIKAAIRFLRANSKKYFLNPDKIGLWGLSAGAHLACLAGTAAEIPQLEDLRMGNPQESSRVQCVVALYPIIDISKLEQQHMQYGVDPNEACTNDHSMGGMLFGKAPCKVPHLCQLANPENYITKDCPPFFIQHGLADKVVPFQQSILFADKLERIIGKNKVELELFAQVDHAEPFFRTPENTDKIFRFLDKYLK